jgi:hypothetical protein
MLKLTLQEKQALKEFGKSREFKSWQKEVIVLVLLLVLCFVFFWKHYAVLFLSVIVMATIVGIRYSQRLKSFRATYSVGKKFQEEIKRQQEINKRIFLPIIIVIVGSFILFMIGVIIKVLGWK